MLAGVVCAAACASVWQYTSDDAYVTYRLARHAAAAGAGHYSAQATEGAVSPLWAAIATLSEVAGLSPEQVSKGVSLLLALLLCWRIHRFVSELSLVSQLPILVLAAHSPFIAAVVGGTEAAAGAVFMALLFLASYRGQVTWRGLAFWGAMAICAQPQNMVLVGAHAGFLWRTQQANRPRIEGAAACWLGVMLLLMLGRFYYFGDPVTHGALSSLLPSGESLARALDYCKSWLVHYGWLLAFGVPALFDRSARRPAANGWLLIAAQLICVAVTGGDALPQWRLLAFVGVMLCILGCFSAHTLTRFFSETILPARFRVAEVQAIPGAIAVCLALLMQMSMFREDRGGLARCADDQARFAAGPVRFLARHAGPRDQVAARATGLLGYRADCEILQFVSRRGQSIAATADPAQLRSAGDILTVRPEYLVLQSRRTGQAGPDLDPIAEDLLHDARFSQYRLAGSWQLPRNQFCEIYKRRAAARAVETAMLNESEPRP